MATYTPNYNLSKPESTDDMTDFFADYGDNMEIIDENMGGGGGGSNVWIGTQADYTSQSGDIADGTLVTITDDETDIVDAEQEGF